jgi:hypothetical protein
MQRSKPGPALRFPIQTPRFSQRAFSHDLDECVQMTVPMLDGTQRLLDGLGD